jgi:4-hydroxyphenylpyruvate dioxygenase-like putative hemolysin
MVYTFANGDKREVPYAFVEFIERRNGREGFETKNAAQIFTSTQLHKK